MNGYETPFVSSPGGYHDSRSPRPLRRGQLSAYLRVSEGCDHRCSFCLIPQLRGPRRSRFPKDVFAEARDLVERGVREPVLIAQDTTDYGGDLSPRRSLPDLLEEMAGWTGVRRLRVMYASPSRVDDRLIRLLAGEPKLCRYLDMPLQHISDPMLTSMGRDWGETLTRRLLDRLVERVPGLALRTTFIVGFPGETDADFRKLLTLVETGVFEHVGVFRYSPEERTPSIHFPARPPEKTAEERKTALIDAQSSVLARRARSRLGTEVEALVESFPDNLWVARAPWQAPEVDGGLLLDRYPGTAGFFRARITGRKGVDMTAQLLDPRMGRHPGGSRGPEFARGPGCRLSPA